MCILDHMYSTFFCLGKFHKQLADDQYSSMMITIYNESISTISNIMYLKNLLAWKWIDQKFDI